MKVFTRRRRTPRASWHLLVVTAVFFFASLAQLASPVVSALSTTSSGLVIGSYNVLHCFDAGGTSIKTRMKIVAGNIQSLGYDIVGVQEYNYPACRGDILEALNASGGQWQETEQTNRYQMDQPSILFNSSVVTLTSQELVDIDRPSNTKPTYISGHDANVQGGTRYAHIAHFTDRNGRSFVVANVHLATFDGVTVANHRKEEITNLMKKLEAETVPVIITGDMNAATGSSSNGQKAPWKAFYTTVAQYGYSVAHDTALVKQNELLASIGSSTKSANTIDQIFYKNMSAPSYYETVDCVSQANGLGSCGSDHHPIKAIFNDLSGSGGAVNCAIASNETGTFSNEYKALNNIHYTGNGVVCCNTASGPSQLVGDTNAEKAYNFLITTPISTNGNKPLSAAQAAGAVGNFMRESGGDTYNLKPDYSSPYGIVQWLGARWSNPKAKQMTGLKEFAASKGAEWSDLKIQLEFIVYELENTESAIIKDPTFLAVDNNIAGARTAAERWDTLYERSGGAGIVNRQDNAVQVFKDFTDGYIPATTDDQTEVDEGNLYNEEGDASTLSVNVSNSQAGCTAAIGDTVFPLQATKVEIRQWGNNPGTTEWTSGRYHETKIPGYYAVDIMSVEGTPVVSTVSGKIISKSTSDYFAGALQIQIMSDNGFVYFYQHMSGSRGGPVEEGATVDPGTVIGYVGNKAEGGGAVVHLHIDKAKPDAHGFRGDCAASIPGVGCAGATEGRFMKDLFIELHDSYEDLPETGASSL